MERKEFTEIEPEYETEERAFESSDEKYVISKSGGDWFLQEKLAEDLYENVAEGNNLQELKENAREWDSLVIELDLGKLDEGGN